MINDLKLGDSIVVGESFPPFIVAEMSGNHNQSLDRALQIVEAAAQSGAHALKLQTYTADTITLDVKVGEFFIKDEKSLWKGNSLYDLYKIAHTPWEWHKPIIEKCKKLGLLCFSSPFDETAVDFLESLNMPAYKIASFENTHLPLIRKVAQTGKPVIVSTGMATETEIEDTVKTLIDSGCKQYALLKCTSSYPADPKNSNVLTIPDLKKQFKCIVGLSDHTMGIGAAIAAISHGAKIIEKHFTLDRKDGGVDSAFSLQPEEMKLLVKESINAWQSLGKVSYGPTDSEKGSLKFRRSLYVSKDMKKSEIFTKENLRIVRPGYGLEPKYYDKVLGKKATKELNKGTALKWEFLE
jgi:pseudaminic acid synthase